MSLCAAACFCWVRLKSAAKPALPAFAMRVFRVLSPLPHPCMPRERLQCTPPPHPTIKAKGLDSLPYMHVIPTASRACMPVHTKTTAFYVLTHACTHAVAHTCREKLDGKHALLVADKAAVDEQARALAAQLEAMQRSSQQRQAQLAASEQQLQAAQQALQR